MIEEHSNVDLLQLHIDPTKRPAAAKFITIKHDPATTITSLYAAQVSIPF